MILLDTHVWLWWLSGERSKLRPSWQVLLEGTEPLAISAVSCFEATWLIRRGRVEVNRPLDEWFGFALEGSGVGVVEVTYAIARLAAELPEHHRDPHDRMIIATAVTKGSMLLSADDRFPAYVELSGRLVQAK